MLLGRRIKALRKEKGWTQQQLGNMISVTKVSICCYENGSRNPTLQTLTDLAKVFRVDINYFLGNDVYVVSDSDENYKMPMSNEEIDFITEIRKHNNLHQSMIEDPRRLVKLIDKKVK